MDFCGTKAQPGAKLWVIATGKIPPLHYVTCLVYHGRPNSTLPMRLAVEVQELEKYFAKLQLS